MGLELRRGFCCCLWLPLLKQQHLVQYHRIFSAPQLATEGWSDKSWEVRVTCIFCFRAVWSGERRQKHTLSLEHVPVHMSIQWNIPEEFPSVKPFLEMRTHNFASWNSENQSYGQFYGQTFSRKVHLQSRGLQNSTRLQWVCSSHVREKARKRRNWESLRGAALHILVDITALFIGTFRFYLKSSELVIRRITVWFELIREFSVMHQSKSNNPNWFSVQVWFDSLATDTTHKVKQWAVIEMLEPWAMLCWVSAHSALPELLKKAWLRSSFFFF